MERANNDIRQISSYIMILIPVQICHKRFCSKLKFFS